MAVFQYYCAQTCDEQTFMNQEALLPTVLRILIRSDPAHLMGSGSLAPYRDPSLNKLAYYRVFF
jgi:hypothetical protein